MKIDDFHLKFVDIIFVFVFGFTFLIMAIDLSLGMGYLFFMSVGSIYMTILNYYTNKKKKRLNNGS